MIITRQKPLDDIFGEIQGKDKIFIVGCTLCATTCKTGGMDQVKQIAEKLKLKDKEITGWCVLDPTCNLLEIKRMYRAQKNEVDACDVILSLSCGGGTQALVDIIPGKEVVPGNDTLFQGEITKSTLKGATFSQKCSLCGDCMLWETGGLCPVTLCPKGLINGPCGGVKNGKCEVNSELDCVWMKIYDRLKKLGRLDQMKKVRLPRDNSKNKKPQNLDV